MTHTIANVVTPTGQRSDLGVGEKRPPRGGGPAAARAASDPAGNILSIITRLVRVISQPHEIARINRAMTFCFGSAAHA